MSTPPFQVELDIYKTEKGNIECNGFNGNSIMKSLSTGLTCYEIVCFPRKILNESELSFCPNQIERVVKEILRCAICYEIYYDPVNIKTCLHKFCKKCIEDYNRKIKKECAICRHPIETRRLTKEDSKIKEIISCMIPNIEKFKQDEEKEIVQSIPNYIFKDEDRIKHQNEKAFKVEDIPTQELRNNVVINNNQNKNNLLVIQNNQQEIPSEDREEPNNDNNNPQNKENGGSSGQLLNKKKLRIDQLNQGIPGKEIEVKINCDECGDILKRFFHRTKLNLHDNFTLEFISKFICYKQNFPHDHLQKITFYTLDQNNEKTFWEQNDSLKKVKDKLFQGKISIEKTKDNVEKLTLYFLLQA